ncbi:MULTISPECIES: glycosyltransferase family 2 protein [Methylotenera]|uniref:glycosyltransferase family 2 protein n=1 Tax=Methylotenera TaxID=359407 RepID=UPI00036307F0|nr:MULTISPECIES: glycosyltransferase family 2 protein [Methylotenera]
MKQPKFTVFTPAYNRAHTLHRVWDSLQTQTYRDFEWIVIDDGSVDKTAELIATWKAQADFPVTYQYQVNSGRHIAFNRAVALAKGELFFVIDSDDGFSPNAIEVMLKAWEDIPADQRHSFTGVVTRCQGEDGKPCTPDFTPNPLDTNALDLRFKYKIRGELWGFHRTSIMKAYPFPEDTTLRYVPENLIWDAIARKYKIRCINDALRVYYQDSGNQLSKGDPRKKALHRNYSLKIINRDFDYFLHDPVNFFKWTVLYVRYSFHAGDVGFMNPKKFTNMGAYLLSCLAVLPGFAVFGVDYIRRITNI